MNKDLLNMIINLSNYGSDGKQHTRFINQYDAKDILNYMHKREQEINKLNNIISDIERIVYKWCQKDIFSGDFLPNAEQQEIIEKIKELKSDNDG